MDLPIYLDFLEHRYQFPFGYSYTKYGGGGVENIINFYQLQLLFILILIDLIVQKCQLNLFVPCNAREADI